MSVEEAGLVEEDDAAPEGGWGHVSILPQGVISSLEIPARLIRNYILPS